MGVGSNLGSREASIRAARALLDAREGIEVTAVSPLYETEPLGPPQPPYLNAAFRLETALAPIELLRVLVRTERRLGRDRKNTERWGARSLDLDLLWDDRGPHESRELCVPHPELEKRSFAMTPLIAVAPELQSTYGPLLAQTGGTLIPWDRAAQVSSRRRAGVLEIEVEADALADACTLTVAIPAPLRPPHSTLHRIIDSSASAFADALREVFRTGFSVQYATVSHCSTSQWIAQFHGVNLAIPLDRDVRLMTTSGATREFRAALSL
ncbi:MAG: 2-amino-4-hydroxy-6-hydroxymethyldihydropteridine diphosphokinase [Myxococcales bacterium]|nr:2-amino-4-hydroxy-6-hydroxymethyldihydropteridine diphosphokinase [Myxococcales bacterium]